MTFGHIIAVQVIHWRVWLQTVVTKTTIVNELSHANNTTFQCGAFKFYGDDVFVVCQKLLTVYYGVYTVHRLLPVVCKSSHTNVYIIKMIIHAL